MLQVEVRLEAMTWLSGMFIQNLQVRQDASASYTIKVPCMKIKYIYTCIALCFALTFSCVTNKNVTDMVKVVQSKETLDISSLTDSVHVVKPSSSDPQSAIARVDRVLSMNDRLYVVDRTANKLMCFDSNGDFISSTEPIIGHGRMEYARIMDATVDPGNSMVYIFCDASYKIIRLDADLNAIDSFSFDDLFVEIAVAGDYLYALCKKDDSFELRQYRTKDLKGKHDTLLRQTELIRGVRSIGKSMHSDGISCYVAFPFSNSIYRICEGEVESETIVDFGALWYDYEQNKGLRANQFLDKNDDKAWIIMNPVVTDSLTLFNTNRADITSINANRQGASRFDITNRDFPFASTLIYPLGGVYGAAVMVAENEHISRYKNVCKEKGIDLSDDSSKLNKWIREYSPKDNPILVVEYLRVTNEQATGDVHQ